MWFLCGIEQIFNCYSNKIQTRNDYVRFEVFTAVTRKNAVFWNVAPCRYCINRRFGGTYGLHLQGRRKYPRARNQREQPLRVTENRILRRMMK
jgi:hypothetical protein